MNNKKLTGKYDDIRVGVGGRIREGGRIWIGKWYKPWTWLKFGYEIRDYELREMSFVCDPSNS